MINCLSNIPTYDGEISIFCTSYLSQKKILQGKLYFRDNNEYAKITLSAVQINTKQKSNTENNKYTSRIYNKYFGYVRLISLPGGKMNYLIFM